MRIGYGYKRREADFIAAGCEKAFIDTPGTDRLERTDMLRSLRSGESDVVVVFAMSDLVRGGERDTILPLIEEKGATVEVYEAAKPPPVIQGRPPIFKPDPDQEAHIKKLWEDRALTLAYVLRRASEIMGHPVKHHHLRHKFGGRREKD